MNSEPTLARQPASKARTIRYQLIWAALFPLILVGLLSALVTSTIARQLASNLAISRSTALAQLSANAMAQDFHPPEIPAAFTQLQLSKSMHGYLVNPAGDIVAQTGIPVSSLSAQDRQDITALTRNGQLRSQLQQFHATGGKAVISCAPIGDSGWGLVLEEPLETAVASTTAYQLTLIGLLFLGIILSATMLSVSIGRVMRPIADLAHKAGQVIPRSIFRPIQEQGPAELQELTHAFNLMVIRLAEQQAAIRQFAQQALLSQEAERQRLPYELHDGTVQDLVGLVQWIDLCRNELDRDIPAAGRRLDELNQLARSALDDVRRISNALRPSILEDLGLFAALLALCDELEQQVPGITCSCEVKSVQERLPADLELAIFRITQDALLNIRRHARNVSRVGLSMEIEGQQVRMTISDDGPGFIVQGMRTLVHEGHLGITGMYEWARLFGGEVEITPEPGCGSTLRLCLPYRSGDTTQ